MARQGTLHLHVQQPVGLGPAKRPFRILKLGDQCETEPVIRLSVERRADMPYRPLEETHSERRLEMLHRIRHR